MYNRPWRAAETGGRVKSKMAGRATSLKGNDPGPGTKSMSGNYESDHMIREEGTPYNKVLNTDGMDSDEARSRERINRGPPP